MVAAVNFARQNSLLVAVRGAGHNVAGTSLCDGGLVIDLSRMKSVRVDQARGTVRVAAGAIKFLWKRIHWISIAFGSRFS